MAYGTLRFTFLVVLVALFLFVQVSPVRAESYTLTISPPRTQEQNSLGLTMALAVAGGSVGQPYNFTWVVIDPSGGNKTDITTTSGAFNFTISVVYPRDFGAGAAVKYVGSYTVNIAQTSPIFAPSVANGHFDVGLTDKESYQRTYPVSIKASSYNTNDNVMISITHAGVPAPGFPQSTRADGSGNVAYSWQTGPGLATGNYTVTLSGRNTPAKSPADTQTFIVYPTNVTISKISMPSVSLQRTDTAQFSFSATYPSGGPVQSGTASLRVAEPDGTSHVTTAYYVPGNGLFLATYRVPMNGQTGLWAAVVDVNSLDDGYGNGGPSASTPKGFSVSQAVLTVGVSLPNGTQVPGDIMVISAMVTSPDGGSFTQGTVTAQLLFSGNPVGSTVTLGYDQTKDKWVGSYTVKATDPSGLWLVQVVASDPYGNSGQGSSSTLVRIPSQQSVFTTIWFWSVIGTIAAWAVLGFVFFQRKRILRHRLQVDLAAVGLEARRVMDQDFFKSIREQLGRKRDESGGAQ